MEGERDEARKDRSNGRKDEGQRKGRVDDF